jgi:hypothetical protein
MLNLMIAGLFTNFKLSPYVDFFGKIVPLEIIVVFVFSTVVLFALFVLLSSSRTARRVEQQSNRAKIAFARAQSRGGS